MAFHVGQKVVCVRQVEEYYKPMCKVPTVGEVYVLRFVGPDDCTLIEIVNPRMLCQHTKTGLLSEGEPTFDLNCFRPITERKTDISIFTEMLNPSRVTTEVMLMADHLREIVQ